MGSFNIKCFASGQAITEGAPCRVIAIRQATSFHPVTLTYRGDVVERYGNFNATCTPDAFWTPVSPFIEATYADYGQVAVTLSERSRSDVLRLVRRLRRQDIVAQSHDGDETFDLGLFIRESAGVLASAMDSNDAVLPASEQVDVALAACWDYIWAAAEKGMVFSAHSERGLCSVQFAVIHEDAYQALVALSANSVGDPNHSRVPAEFLARALTEAKASLAAYQAEQAKEAPPENDAQRTVKELFSGFYFADRMRHCLSMVTQVSRHELTDMDLFSALSAAFTRGELTEAQLTAQLVPLVLPLYAVSAMENLGIKFSPVETVGGGPGNESGVTYAEFVTEVSQRIQRGHPAVC